jgi:hypothetical protein
MDPAARARARDKVVPALFAVLTLLAHLAVLTRYGWFRDELYFVACSKHLAWGFVDHPPLSIAVLALWRLLFGEALGAVRLAPALLGALSVFLVGLIARDLGGRRFAQALACLGAFLAPGFLGITSIYSMNSFDLLLWTLAAWVLLRALRDGHPTDWMLLGLVLGLGLLNKISVLWLGTGLFVGLLATPHRRNLTTPWPWLAGALALALFVPHLVWQVERGWPTLEFMRNAMLHKMVRAGPLEFLGAQVVMLGPANAPLWLLGLGWCLFARSGREGRILAVLYLTVLVILLVSPAARTEYLLVAYGMLFAAGAVALERFTRTVARRWLRFAAPAIIVLLGLPVVPMALPVLGVDAFIAYSRALGAQPRGQERTRPDELPQHFADMFGWEEMAERVGGVYQDLPPEERARCAVFTSNYGEAGALDRFGAPYGLPPALSGHNNYWLWGPRGYTGELVIVLGARRGDLEEMFHDVTLADSVRCRHCMPYERDLPVWVCRDLRVPLREAWARLKVYI